MASPSILGSRRNAAQLRALAGVERELRANDSSPRRKYLREFRSAFQSYECVLDSQQLDQTVRAADILLVADYHALPAAQRYAAGLLERRAQPGDRPIVLGVETIFSRHQHVLEEWWRRAIDASELRERIRFDTDWGYDWNPFYELLVTAREHAEAVYGLDCMPRDDLRKIGARDRHAADKIAEIRQQHPNAVILVLFGESHFAPSHLPRLLAEHLPNERCLTVLQNVDALYWSASENVQEPVDAVRVNDDVVCVFTSSPLEKYENYRLCLTRWNQQNGNYPDATPTVYNLIDSLATFLQINRYSSHNTTQPKFLIDKLPEVYSGSDARLAQLLLRAFRNPKKVENMLQRVDSHGSIYLPSINAFYVREFQMMYTAEEAARFLHHACRGLPLLRNRKLPRASLGRKDRFYIRIAEDTLAWFGSRVLYPMRSIQGRGAVLSEAVVDRLVREACREGRAKFDDAAQQLGYRLGDELYNAYMRGSVSPSTLRRLFLTHVDEPARASRLCRDILHCAASTPRKPCGSVGR